MSLIFLALLKSTLEVSFVLKVNDSTLTRTQKYKILRTFRNEIQIRNVALNVQYTD